jgi:formiminoglutamase
MTDIFTTHQGTSPVILAFPHTGTYVPADIAACLNHNGRLLADTDWHIDHLYDGLLADVTTVTAKFHRYVIDANRDPEGVSLYPGQNTTTLIPQTDFDGLAIWKDGGAPDEADIAARIATFHRPYHAAIAAEIARVKAIHGIAIVYDCHSIRSKIPFLFEGVLPDFNIGTDLGRTCAPEIEAAVATGAQQASGYTAIINGRFKGGWTTRHYGQPETAIHAIQMELAQSAYLTTEAVPFAYDEEKSSRLRIHLKQILTELEKTAFSLKTAGEK